MILNGRSGDLTQSVVNSLETEKSLAFIYNLNRSSIVGGPYGLLIEIKVL